MSESNTEVQKPKRATAHKIEVRRRPGSEGTIQTGATTEIYLDGKRLGGAYFFKFEVHAKKVAKAHIEMFCEVDIEADLLLEETTHKTDLLSLNSGIKTIDLYTLSSYGPKITATKKIPK